MVLLANSRNVTKGQPLLRDKVAAVANETVLLSRKRYQGGLSEAEEALLGRYIDFLKERAEHLHHLRHHLQGSRIQTTPEACAEQHKTSSTRSSSSSSSSRRKSRRTKRLFHDRACTHCHTHFTSQWRAGPMGPSSYRPPPPSQIITASGLGGVNCNLT